MARRKTRKISRELYTCYILSSYTLYVTHRACAKVVDVNGVVLIDVDYSPHSLALILTRVVREGGIFVRDFDCLVFANPFDCLIFAAPQIWLSALLGSKKIRKIS